MSREVDKPTLCIVLGDGEQWWVEAEWPDGTIEQINNFKRHADAVHWLKLHCDVWVQERTAVQAAKNPQLISTDSTDYAAAMQGPPHKGDKI